MDEPVDEIPAGFKVHESVNGVVSLVRDVPSRFLSDEVAAVEAAIRKHPRASQYRVDQNKQYITVYERAWPDVDELAAILGQTGLVLDDRLARLREALDPRARYTAVLRFGLRDRQARIFYVERVCYLSSNYGWLPLSVRGTIAELTPKVIPTLGTDAFFELW